MKKEVITLDHLTLEYGDQRIFDDISLSIQEGDFVVVLGPNGAGKSTFFKVLLGLIKPTVGKVSVLGLAPGRGNKDIGYAPQHRTLETDVALRARDVVGFGLDGNEWGVGIASKQRRLCIDSMLKEVDAFELANAPIGELSGGEQQRLLIAQALITNPKILLLDEPLSNLDINYTQEIVTLISKLCEQRGITTLLVAHDINPLLSVLDTVLYIAHSHVVLGTPNEIITSTTLSKLYSTQVDVLHSHGRIFVIGAEV